MFDLYRITEKYADYISKQDKNAMFSAGAKKNRLFVGIAFDIEGTGFFAPLTSPKPKHRTMKKKIDFIKIEDGKYGAINLNNMIPVPTSELIPISHELPPITSPEYAYASLISNQRRWCGIHKKEIMGKAKHLYNTILSGQARPELKERCCDFTFLKTKCQEYEAMNIHPENNGIPDNVVQFKDLQAKKAQAENKKSSVKESLKQIKAEMPDMHNSGRASKDKSERNAV